MYIFTYKENIYSDKLIHTTIPNFSRIKIDHCLPTEEFKKQYPLFYFNPETINIQKYQKNTIHNNNMILLPVDLDETQIENIYIDLNKKQLLNNKEIKTKKQILYDKYHGYPQEFVRNYVLNFLKHKFNNVCIVKSLGYGIKIFFNIKHTRSFKLTNFHKIHILKELVGDYIFNFIDKSHTALNCSFLNQDMLTEIQKYYQYIHYNTNKYCFVWNEIKQPINSQLLSDLIIYMSKNGASKTFLNKFCYKNSEEYKFLNLLINNKTIKQIPIKSISKYLKISDTQSSRLMHKFINYKIIDCINQYWSYQYHIAKEYTVNINCLNIINLYYIPINNNYELPKLTTNNTFYLFPKYITYGMNRNWTIDEICVFILSNNYSEKLNYKEIYKRSKSLIKNFKIY